MKLILVPHCVQLVTHVYNSLDLHLSKKLQVGNGHSDSDNPPHTHPPKKQHIPIKAVNSSILSHCNPIAALNINVEETYLAHLNARGMMPIILDTSKSRGTYLIDENTGRQYLDFFGFYASSTLGMNPPELTEDDAFRKRLVEAALNKVGNSDIRTSLMARFLQTFYRVAVPDFMQYAFFISGGALAVENALKAAFDWKVRKNCRKGYVREHGHQVLHFEKSFHGRSGYTLSLTNTTDVHKVANFPKFDWPRVCAPSIQYPVDERIEATKASEDLCIRQAKQHFLERKDDIACAIIEPIQGEGGDNHFRPEFLHRLQTLCLENDALLIFDEVQTGVGITGTFWAQEGLGIQPDITAFGKKTQVCGILAGNRMEEVEDHVFVSPSRINSTWGGNLVDMVRFDKVLEVVEAQDLVANAADVGSHLLQGLHNLARDRPQVQGVRGRGLMCALDLPTREVRERVRQKAFELGLILLGCGVSTIRFRPPLNVTRREIDEGVSLLAQSIDSVVS